jgi:hypothetical protein
MVACENAMLGKLQVRSIPANIRKRSFRLSGKFFMVFSPGEYKKDATAAT